MSSISQREIVFWATDDGEEHLTHETEDEAISDYLDDSHDEDKPDSVMLYGYARMKVPDGWANPLEIMIENLDDEFGSDDGDPTEITDTMRAAEKAFVSAVLSEYTVWACEVVTTKEIDLRQWIIEHG